MAGCFVRAWWWDGSVVCFHSCFEAWSGRFSVAEMMALSGGKEGVWVAGWRFCGVFPWMEIWWLIVDFHGLCGLLVAESALIDFSCSSFGCIIYIRCMLFFWSCVVNNYKNIDSYKIFSLCFLVCGCFLFYLCIRFRVIF